MSDAPGVIIAAVVVVVFGMLGVAILGHLGDSAEAASANDELSGGQDSLEGGFGSFIELAGVLLPLMMIPVLFVALMALGAGG